MSAGNVEAKVRLGRTRIEVTPICFGTSGLGNMPGTYGYAVDEEQARTTIRAIFAGPANFLDTSRNYGTGRSEERIGSVIKELGGLPNGFVVSTKLDRDFDTSRFDAARARRSLEESLKALNVSRVQLLHLHDPEHCASLAEVTAKNGPIAELFKMKAEGLCDAVGLAAGQVDLMLPLLKDWDFDALITHNRFTLVNRNAEAMIAFAAAKGIAVLNAAPYAGGVFAKGAANYTRYAYQEASEAILAPVKQVEATCARYGIPPGAAALQFSLQDKRIASTICGVSKPERVAETLAWATHPIPPAVWDELRAITTSKDDPEATRDYKLG
jgi:D-threo-aldose 1-dehydrogenase